MNKLAAIWALGLAAMMLPAAAQAQSGCTAYDAQAKTINPTLDNAVDLISDQKVQEGIALLPDLEALLATVPAKFPAPQRCGPDVLVFDDHQFAEFQDAKQAGKAVQGYPATSNFVFRDIPFADLAYITGWLTYEKGDFDKALTFYQKGLVIAPNDHNLVNEVLATMIQQSDGPGLVAFSDKFLQTDKDADAKVRSNVMLSKAIGQAFQGDSDAALISTDLALELWPESENAQDMKAQLTGS